MLDTLEQRWALLEAGVVTVGPEDDRPRPTVLLFHGCGGLRDHLPLYAAQAKAAGWRAAIVDSYGPRGWSRNWAIATVCTGLQFRGDQRAGDILAAIQGVGRRADVDETRLVLAGWSHGGWGIMEAMSADRSCTCLGVCDPGCVPLEGVRGVWLAYPYVGMAAMNRMRPWRHCPRVLAVTASKDHLTTVRNAERVNAMIRGCGAEVESWVAEGSHSFDEPMSAPPMRHDPKLSEQALKRFRAFLEDVAPADVTPP